MGLVKIYFEEKLDESLIYETWEAAFKRTLNQEYWRWRFIDNPNEKKTYIAYIILDGILATYYAISPIYIHINNTKVKSGLINMAMTHPKYQGSGYLIQAANTLHKVLQDNRFENLISFPTRGVTHKIFKNYYNWIDIFSLFIFRANKTCFKLEQLNKKSKFDFETKIVDQKIIELVASHKPKGKSVYPLWNNESLRWRLINNPVHKYFYLKVYKNNTIYSVIFYKYYDEDNIDIIKIYQVNSYKDEFELIKESFLFFINQDMQINIWSNKYDNKFLLQLGFINSNFETKFGSIPLKKNSNINKPEEWQISFIDSDVY